MEIPYVGEEGLRDSLSNMSVLERDYWYKSTINPANSDKTRFCESNTKTNLYLK